MTVIGPIPQHVFKNMNVLKKSLQWFKTEALRDEKYDPAIVYRNIEAETELFRENMDYVMSKVSNDNKKEALAA